MGEQQRATAAFALLDARCLAVRRGEGEALIGDAQRRAVTVSFLDADAMRAADYSIEFDLWPESQLVLSRLGRRFDTFTAQSRSARRAPAPSLPPQQATRASVRPVARS